MASSPTIHGTVTVNVSGSDFISILLGKCKCPTINIFPSAFSFNKRGLAARDCSPSKTGGILRRTK